MVIRLVAGTLWFVAVGWGSNYLSAWTGTPSFVGTFVALAVGVFVVTDPLHAIWPAPRARATPTSSEQAVPRGLHTQV